MFGLGQIGRLGALASSVARAWSPLSLWPDGISSAGMWISPRDLTSQWQDYTGTTPVVTPGTVADSSNPVGLALDIRAGAPEVLGPDVVTNGDFAAGSTGWTLETDWSISGGQAHVTNASNIWAIYQAGLTPGKTYLISFTITSLSAGGLTPYCGDNLRDINANTVGTHTAIMVCGSNGFLGVRGLFVDGAALVIGQKLLKRLHARAHACCGAARAVSIARRGGPGARSRMPRRAARLFFPLR